MQNLYLISNLTEINTKYGRSSVGLALPYCELAVKAVLQNIPTTLHNFYEEKTKEEWFLLSDDKKYRLLLETLPNRIACQVATFRYQFVSVFYFWIFERILYLYLPNRISWICILFSYIFVLFLSLYLPNRISCQVAPNQSKFVIWLLLCKALHFFDGSNELWIVFVSVCSILIVLYLCNICVIGGWVLI